MTQMNEGSESVPVLAEILDVSHFIPYLRTFRALGTRPDSRRVSKARLLSQDLVLLIWQVATSAS